MQINDFPALRYSITDASNGGMFNLQRGRGPVTSPRMTLYSQLIEKHLAELRQRTRATAHRQVLRNHLTALRVFLKSVYKSEDSVIGTEMGADFDERLNHHLKTCPLSDRSKADRKSLLGSWKATFDGMESSSAAQSSSARERRHARAAELKPNAFQIALKEALDSYGMTAYGAARAAGISTYAVCGWARGKLPSRRTVSSIEKLEATLNLQPGTLTGAFAQCTSTQHTERPNPYRERLKAISKLRYRIYVRDATPSLQQEWKALLHYKTATRVPESLKRSAGGEWSLSQARHSAATPSWVNSVSGGLCHTAEKCWNQVAAFLGFIQLAATEGGYGRGPSEAQTLAWLCVPDAVDAFLTFMSNRSDGLKHEGHKSFSSLVKNLTREKYGYLRQMPAFGSRLPADVVREEVWEQLCERAHETAVAWGRASVDTSRDPDLTISYFLEQSQPLQPIFDAMRGMRRASEGCTPGSRLEAVLRRDELLLGVLVSNPLRAKNLKILTWKPDNSGHVYKTAAGQWRLRIEPREFKNRKGKKKVKTYDVAVAKWLVPTLEAYLNFHREKLCPRNPGSAILFPNARNGGVMSNLNCRILELTKRYIPGSGGMGPHAFRHLVATVWLQNHTNDFLTVAELLNDTLQVVLSNYSHLKKDTSFGRYEAFIASVM